MKKLLIVLLIPLFALKANGQQLNTEKLDSFFQIIEENNKGMGSYISNGSDYSLKQILVGVLSIYFEKEFALPNFENEIILKEEETTQYEGVYSSLQFPLKITIFSKGNTLFAQATGQGAFPLTPLGENKFEFSQAGIKMEFIPEEGKMKFEQGGGKFTFTKD